MNRGVILVFVFFCVLCECRKRKSKNKIEIVPDPDISRNVSELILNKGYPEEDHTVQTADGFILSMQRIPGGRTSSSQGSKKQVVFLQHGLLSAASDWVINFPDQSLGFILADAGYDVWLGNTRGNTYSRKHVKYTPDQREFWNFSFDEMGKYDLPAMIDYVLKVTGEEKLYYVGHSQGTTAAFALFSENPDYEKMKLFIALAPVATVGHITSAIRLLAPFTNDIELFFELFGVNEFLPSNTFTKVISETVCESSARIICENIMFLLFGADRYQLNETRLGVYTAHTPAGSSSKSVIHYGQMVNSKLFTKFDYGKDNVDHYHQKTPPEYDVSRITTPVALLWSTNDKLADPEDVHLLEEKLKYLVSSYHVHFLPFNHVDFVLAIDAHKLVHDQVMSLLSRY